MKCHESYVYSKIIYICYGDNKGKDLMLMPTKQKIHVIQEALIFKISKPLLVVFNL